MRSPRDTIVDAAKVNEKLRHMFMLWKFEYSAGRNLDELRTDFEKLLTMWVPKMDRFSLLTELLDLAALARAFGLHALCDPLHVEGAIDFDGVDRIPVIQWLVGDPQALPLTDHTNLEWPEAAANLNALALQAIDAPENASAALETYVTNNWYDNCNEEPWFNSHDYFGNGPERYFGYWCFHAAAIASACGVNDSALEGHKYYPHDLAHYLD